MNLSEKIIIKGITEPTVERYFETLNAEDYCQAATLFTPEGELHPPFESPIMGHEAIANYLQAEAKGMRLYPLTGTVAILETGYHQVSVKGKVQTPLFSVNVAWTFVLNERQDIMSVKVKLLASLEELASLQR